MRQAMAGAAVGDDVYGEDPTVNRLEQLAAALLGTEAAIFAPSGTQTNLMALMSHCGRGDEYIVGQTAHTYRFEGGGGAVLGSIQPQPLDFERDGTLDLDKVRGVIKPEDVHFAKTRLLCLENTQGGLALPLAYLEQARRFAQSRRLKLHLDGARIFNAAVKLNIPAKEIARHFDSVSVCLSKGLGAPVGSLLCASRELIQSARRWRKVLGGGMRQAGILAAAGIYALEHHIDRLAVDHENAALLARELGGIDGLQVDYQANQTNMVFIEMAEAVSAQLAARLQEEGILINTGARVRLVIHLDVGRPDVLRTAAAIRDFFDRGRSAGAASASSRKRARPRRRPRQPTV
jgi:threonine aldolase